MCGGQAVKTPFRTPTFISFRVKIESKCPEFFLKMAPRNFEQTTLRRLVQCVAIRNIKKKLGVTQFRPIFALLLTLTQSQNVGQIFSKYLEKIKIWAGVPLKKRTFRCFFFKIYANYQPFDPFSEKNLSRGSPQENRSKFFKLIPFTRR